MEGHRGWRNRSHYPTDVINNVLTVGNSAEPSIRFHSRLNCKEKKRGEFINSKKSRIWSDQE